MTMSKLVPDEQGYLINPDNGAKVIFWECDPTKNFLCTKSMCRGHAGSDAENGFCATTPERAFAKEGARPFYKRLNSDGYFSREYIAEGEGSGHDD